MTTRLYIPVTTTPFAALLAGHGLAVWLAELGYQISGDMIDIHVGFTGQAVVLTSPFALDPQQVQLSHYQQPIPQWILTAKNSPAPDGVKVLHYDDERTSNTAYYERLKGYRKAGMDLRKLPEDEKQSLDQQAPKAFWPVAAAINQMSALNAYNKAITRWAECKPIYPDLVRLIWVMCSGDPGAIEQAMEQWSALAKTHGLEKSPLLAATQVVNPEQGKGANRAKADALSIGGMDSFWLLEYFKYVGMYHGALPRTVKGRKDRKTYILMPSAEGMEREFYQRIFTKFQQTFWADSAIKMDILATLRYTDLLLADREAAEQSSGFRRHAAEYLAGFVVASYKDLGSAVAIMNVATLHLPDWVDWPGDAAQAQLLRQALEEQQRIISALDETKSEEEHLLRDYRDAMTSRDPTLRAFFRFTTGYAGHILRKLNKRQRVRRIALPNLERIIMAQESNRPLKLKPIIETPGFRNIATAIRLSTVQQQFYKTERNDNTYEVRYGLADELLRRSRNDHEFMRALSDFLIDYSKENARAMERAKNKKYRKRIPISTEDIAQVAELVDVYDAQTVANMLIAFGYARDPRSDDDQEVSPTSSDDNTPAADDQSDDADEESPF